MKSRVMGKALAVLVLTLSIAALLLYRALTPTPQAEASKGLRIAVTFPSLRSDVEALLCEGDTVETIVPPGVDPHDHQLAPKDVELLRSSHLVVSTGHAPFEERILEMVKKGELRVELVNIPDVPGLKILTNPVTQLPNLHMPIYDPENYRTFLKSLVAALAKLRPECAEVYKAREQAVEEELTRIVAKAPHLDVAAVALSPVVQYAVEWMGVKVKYLLIKEHGLPASPEDLAAVERALSSGDVGLIVSVEGMENTPLGMKAKELAIKYGKPIIYVPSGDSPEGTLTKIAKAVQEVGRVSAG